MRRTPDADWGAVEIARRFVLKTNNWPGFRGLYRHGYEFGLSFTTSRLKSLPDILAVLLRVGEEGRAWAPGLSDYDLTLLTERLDGPRTICFLEEVWARYRQIKKAVPQLGETEIMNPEEYVDFLSFGPMPTAALKRADPLFVRPGSAEIEAALHQRARVSGEREFLLDALSRYISFFFPAWLHQTSDASHFAKSRAEHLLQNIAKRLRRLGVETKYSESFADRIHQVFEDLSRLCCGIRPHLDTAPVVVCPGAWKATEGAMPLVQEFCSEVLRQTIIRNCSVILWISYMTADKLSLAFVIPDETPRNERWNLVATLGTWHRNTEDLWKSFFTNGELQSHFPSLSYPVVLSASMWNCWRELSPFNGAAVAASGRALMGPEHVLHGAPSRAALMRGAEVQYAALLPLKNNWRPLRGSGTATLYEAMVNYVKGYTSATSGDVLTAPERHSFKSAQDGYQRVCGELQALRKKLTAR